MNAKPSECRNQACPEYDRRAEAKREPKDRASFIKRRLFYLNHNRHCEEGAFPDEAIPATVWEIASGKSKYALAMTIYKGTQ